MLKADAGGSPTFIAKGFWSGQSGSEQFESGGFPVANFFLLIMHAFGLPRPRPRPQAVVPLSWPVEAAFPGTLPSRQTPCIRPTSTTAGHVVLYRFKEEREGGHGVAPIYRVSFTLWFQIRLPCQARRLKWFVNQQTTTTTILTCKPLAIDVCTDTNMYHLSFQPSPF